MLGCPIIPVTTKRATLRGTALLALEVLAPDVPREPPVAGDTLHPVTSRTDYYSRRRKQYQTVYERVIAPTPQPV